MSVLPDVLSGVNRQPKTVPPPRENKMETHEPPPPLKGATKGKPPPPRPENAMATAATTAAAKAAMNGDIRSGEDLENYVALHSQFFLDESDLLANTAISLEPRLVARLRKAGLDDARMFGMGSTASSAAKSGTRHLKVAAELQETAP